MKNLRLLAKLQPDYLIDNEPEQKYEKMEQLIFLLILSNELLFFVLVEVLM